MLDQLLLKGLAQSGGSFWMPPQASTAAAGVDRLFYFIFWISAFFFALIVGLMIFFVFRYRRKRASEGPGGGPTHNTALEVAWTIIPLGIVFVIFFLGFRGFLDLNTPPANAYEIQVTAQRWKWLFTYPNGHVDENLHVPVDTPVQLVMTAEDVIHSFYVPDFRIKRDIVPGRYNKTWFRAPQAGEHDLYCAEYCGTSHSDMLAKVIVHPAGEFETWLDGVAGALDRLPPAEAGARLFKTQGCLQCHSVEGKAGIGPAMNGVFGSNVALKDGSTVAADENYIRASILDPQSQIVAGFEPVMPTYKGRLKDKEITVIIEYIKSLSSSGGAH